MTKNASRRSRRPDPSTGYMTTGEYARHWGEAQQTVKQWCEKGQMPGAFKDGRNWWKIPRMARPNLKRPVRRPGRRYQGMSVSEAARRWGVSRIRVYQWIKEGRLKGKAVYDEDGWDIALDAEKPEPQVGRPKVYREEGNGQGEERAD